MRRSVKQIIGYSIGAEDGSIGQVNDFLFDDHAWGVRYLVAGTGKWLPGRRVLISPTAIKSVDWLKSTLNVNLTIQHIEDSPPVDADQPVSRQKELELSQYFAWPAYWAPATPAATWGTAVPPPQLAESGNEVTHVEGDPNLRSIKEVIGYHIQTTDGEMGHVEDFIVEEETWTIRYLVIDTINWWPGKKVILAPGWTAGISWDTKLVRFDLSKEAIKGAPEYDPSEPINREYEKVLYDYYGWPHYWATAENEASGQ